MAGLQASGQNYVVIDKEGNALVKPIKASAFHSKPALNYIEGKFKENEQKQLPGKKHLKAVIDSNCLQIWIN
jgi:hypothetical protein